jgi:hypothetical protein
VPGFESHAESLTQGGRCGVEGIEPRLDPVESQLAESQVQYGRCRFASVALARQIQSPSLSKLKLAYLPTDSIDLV